MLINKLHTSCQSEDNLLKKKKKKQSLKNCACVYTMHLSLQNIF